MTSGAILADASGHVRDLWPRPPQREQRCSLFFRDETPPTPTVVAMWRSGWLALAICIASRTSGVGRLWRSTSALQAAALQSQERAGMTKSREDPTDVPADCVSYHRHPNCDWSRDEIPHWHRVGSDDSYKPFNLVGGRQARAETFHSPRGRVLAVAACFEPHVCAQPWSRCLWTDGNSEKVTSSCSPSRSASQRAAAFFGCRCR